MTIPDSVPAINRGLFDGCSNLARVTLGAGVTNVAYGAFGNTPALAKMTAHCDLPQGADYLPHAAAMRYAIDEQHFPSWIDWLSRNGLTNYTVLDKATGEEARVVLGEGGTNTVGIAAALGLSPARTADAGGVAVTYSMPELSIESFDPAAGRVEVKVTPADGGTVSAAPVASCVAVEGSDDLKAWEEVAASVDSDGYQGTGMFNCTFDPSACRFFKVTVVPAWKR